jgi:hypothetical protein
VVRLGLLRKRRRGSTPILLLFLGLAELGQSLIN